MFCQRIPEKKQCQRKTSWSAELFRRSKFASFIPCSQHLKKHFNDSAPSASFPCKFHALSFVLYRMLVIFAQLGIFSYSQSSLFFLLRVSSFTQIKCDMPLISCWLLYLLRVLSILFSICLNLHCMIFLKQAPRYFNWFWKCNFRAEGLSADC